MNMPTIKAPYNFVPFNKDVVSPHWMDHISHDIPFFDGVSGDIKIKLKAETAIFVRDGIGQQQAKGSGQNRTNEFSRYDGKYFIPGSSVKGMIRNVLEILSFGRMTDKVNNHRYALRELSGAMKDKYLSHFTTDQIYCGWLKKGKDNSYTITDCGLPGRISHAEIDRVFKTNFSTYFSENRQFRANNNKDKSAQKKYQLFGNNDGVKFFGFSKTDAGRDIYMIDEHGNKGGTLVFTGQPGIRKKGHDGKWTGHYLEFIFFEPQGKSEIIVDEFVIDNFFFAYYEHDQPKWSEDWKKWRVDLRNGEPIPVFFHKEKDKVKSLGLSYLYKLPYTHSVVDSINHYQKEAKPDLSDAIFGHIEKNTALKGRVHIGHAFAEKAEVDAEKTEVLASPKASYYPTYIAQKVANGTWTVDRYNSFMDTSPVIAGWKRYPVHTDRVKHHLPNPKNDEISTSFIPLKQGAEFCCTIRYHNLRPIELGALLSALTFHNTEHTYHSIGMAKPLGYGKVSLEIINKEEPEIQKYLCAFESYMNVQLKQTMPKWHQSEQIVELATMAQNAQNVDLAYMSLDGHREVKRKNEKENKKMEALARYSNIAGRKATIDSQCSSDAIKEMKEACAQEEKAMLHTDSILEVVEYSKSATKVELEKEWKELKAKLLSDLKKKKQTIEKKEIEDQEAEKRKVRMDALAEDAAKEGPDLNFNLNIKDAFETLKKNVERWGIAYYAKKNINQVNQEKPNGFLLEKYHQPLSDILKQIYILLNKNTKLNWQKPYNQNAPLKKVAEWVGKEKAEQIFSTFKNN